MFGANVYFDFRYVTLFMSRIFDALNMTGLLLRGADCRQLVYGVDCRHDNDFD